MRLAAQRLTVRTPSGKRPTRPGAPSGGVAARLLELQHTAGNRAVAQLVAAFDGTGTGKRITLHGQTTPHYDGGSGQVSKPRITRAKGCDCPAEQPCLQASATLTVTYAVQVTIDMPGMPGGLTACQQGRVREFLRNVLGPHEREHARRLRTYNGTTQQQFTVKGCGHEELAQAAQDKSQELHTAEADKRAAKADALSAAIDPFDRPIDLNC
jgi:hypothetical protein